MNNIVTPSQFIPEGPQPLLREIPSGAPYPVEALGPLKAVVEAVQSATQAPVAIAAQSALSVASLCVQSHADVETLAGTVPTSLYCLTVAQSGERKSGCDKLIMSGVRDFERCRSSTYREEMAEWNTSHKLWSAKRDRMLKEAAGSNKQKALDAEADLASLPSEPKQPLSPKLTTSEPTLEGLVKLYATGNPSLGLFSDEGGGFLGGHAMNSDNRLKTIAGLSSLWGGEPIDRVRAGDGASTLYGRRLAMHLMVQPIAARPLLSDPVASGQGFLARFLIAEPPSAIGTRLADVGANATNAANAASIANAKALVGQLLDAEMPTNADNEQELQPRTLTLSPSARELLFSYYQATERAQAPGQDLEHVKSFASKSPEQAARIAGVLNLWSDLTSGVVSAETMASAIQLAQFYLSEAKRLAEAATVSDEVDKAERLRKWIIGSWPSTARSMQRDGNTIVPRDVITYGPNSARESATAKRLLKVLEDHGWLVAMEPGAEVDGSVRRVAYKIVGGCNVV